MDEMRRINGEPSSSDDEDQWPDEDTTKKV
jgi:hypothetical protein